MRMSEMKSEFEQECAKVCTDKLALCDIILDVCYKKSSTKKFAWEMCGHEIIRNIAMNKGWMMHYPTLDSDGEIEYGGNRFTVADKRMEEFYELDS